MKKSLTIGITSIVCGVALFQVWEHLEAAGAKANGGFQPATATVRTRDIQFKITASGEIAPAEKVSVRPEINGKIEQLPVDIGDHIKQGGLLFTLDDRNLQIEKETQEIQIERAQIELQLKRRDYDRNQRLFAAHLVSKEVMEQSQTAYELAQNQLEQAQKALALVEDDMRKTQVKAPFDCTVLTRPVSVGQTVAGSGGYNSGTEVMSIADLRQLVVKAHINQVDVARLHAGMPVTVEIEAVPGLRVAGRIERVAPQATIENNIKGFAVRVRLTEIKGGIRPGMTAQLVIPLDTEQQVVAVPLAAVFTERNEDSDEYERFVYVRESQGYRRCLVEVGVADDAYVEIVKGLSPGEVVALTKPPDDEILGPKSGPDASKVSWYFSPHSDALVLTRLAFCPVL